MHKDDKMPKETLGEKMKDKAGEIKEELKQRRNKQQKTLQHIAPKKKRKKVR